MNTKQPDSLQSPAELRQMFSKNLKTLTSKCASISQLSRDLNINRTQFNRYLAGESFPRPDILHKICSYFNVDARILLTPLSALSQNRADFLVHDEMREFFSGMGYLPEDYFPSGLYRFTRHSFSAQDQFITGIVSIYRKDEHTFMKGYEARNAMRQQGLRPCRLTREYKGFFYAQEGGIAGLSSRRNSLTSTFNFLTPVPSFESNFWLGYSARGAIESPVSTRTTRVVMEHLGKKTAEILTAARTSGLCEEQDLHPYHRRLLRLHQPFS